MTGTHVALSTRRNSYKSRASKEQAALTLKTNISHEIETHIPCMVAPTRYMSSLFKVHLVRSSEALSKPLRFMVWYD